MPNMLDYLAWRGDLLLTQDGPNENDMLILAQLAYVAFEGFVPVPGADTPPVAMRRAADGLLAYDPDATKIQQTDYMWKNNKTLLAAMIESRRFGGVLLSGYVNIVSPEDEKQFAALTVTLEDGTRVIAFRGTDSTLVGWKEDFAMSFDTPVPAQREAVAYLESAAATHGGPFYITGHSKGGNLAVYAAACVDRESQRRIQGIYNFDGPGLDEETVRSPGYARVRDRLHVYMPYFSVVGMLLEHEDEYAVVESDAKLILQHDAFSWQMRGTRMLRADGPSKVSLETNHIIRTWLESVDRNQRRQFTSVLFDMLAASNSKTVADLETNWTAAAHAALTALRGLDPDTRAMFQRVLTLLFSTAVKTIRMPWRRDDQDKPDA